MAITLSPVTTSPVTTGTTLHFDDIAWPSPTTALVAVAGEIDLATAHLLRDRLLDVLREHAPAVLRVDLAGVTFLDCTGIGALVAVRNAAIQAGRQLRIINPRPLVRRVLDVTGLLAVFTAPIEARTGLGPTHVAPAVPVAA